MCNNAGQARVSRTTTSQHEIKSSGFLIRRLSPPLAHAGGAWRPSLNFSSLSCQSSSVCNHGGSQSWGLCCRLINLFLEIENKISDTVTFLPCKWLGPFLLNSQLDAEKAQEREKMEEKEEEEERKEE